MFVVPIKGMVIVFFELALEKERI